MTKAMVSRPLDSADFRIPSHTATSQTSSILRLLLSYAAADTALKFCRLSAKSIRTPALSLISKSKKIPKTPRNLNDETAAANFIYATALAPPPSITTGKENTTACLPQAAPSPKKNSAISGKKSSRTSPAQNILNLSSRFGILTGVRTARFGVL